MRALQIFERKVLLSILNSGKIFEGDLLSSDSVAKSATRNLGFSETVLSRLSTFAGHVSRDIRDLAQMRTGDQRTAFDVHNCRNATIIVVTCFFRGKFKLNLHNHLS